MQNVYYLNCAPKNACNEKGTATKEDFQFKILIETHPMGGLVFSSMLDKDAVLKAFFVAVLLSLQNSGTKGRHLNNFPDV